MKIEKPLGVSDEVFTEAMTGLERALELLGLPLDENTLKLIEPHLELYLVGILRTSK